MASEVINCGTAAVNRQWNLWTRDVDIKVGGGGVVPNTDHTGQIGTNNVRSS
jgi:hypothetical protein